MNQVSFPVQSASLAQLITDTHGSSDLKQLIKEHKLSEQEFETIVTLLQRSPTLAEMGVFSAMWSEHCSYKSSRIHLSRLPSEGKRVVVGPGENAGVVRLWGDLCVAFKMESHNHPSFIDPAQGAATGVGGILRDVFCMGARPVASLNALRFGETGHPKTSWLLNGVVQGIGGYGNCVGIPTVGGSVSFDASYNGNILVNAMSVGLIRENRIFKGTASGQGNLVVYVGSATGRDGIHGATMASDSFDSQEKQEKQAVQVGDPFWEKLLLEATLEVLERDLVSGIQDMGAAGLTSTLFEMADRGQSGLDINLDYVPVRTAGMSAYELLLSESQERMAMVVSPEKLPELEEIFKKWGLEYGVIGVVTGSGRVRAYYQGVLEVDVPVSPLAAHAPKYDRPRKQRESLTDRQAPGEPRTDQFQDCVTFPGLLTQAMSACRKGNQDIYQRYDHHIGNRTWRGPDQGGAAVMWVRPDPKDLENGMPEYLGFSAVAGSCEVLCALDPYRGAYETVMKSARMVSAAGGEPLAITDCLNFGNPEDPVVMDDFARSVDGIRDACLDLDIPVVSGNVSLYNETDGQSIKPTPMIGMVGLHEDVRESLPAVVSSPVNLFLLGPLQAQIFLAGSLFENLASSCTQAWIPEPDKESGTEGMAFVRGLGRKGLAVACRDIGAGGLALTAIKMVEASEKGIQFLDQSLEELFGNRSGSWLVAVTDQQLSVFLAESANLEGLATTLVAKVNDRSSVCYGEHALEWDRLRTLTQPEKRGH